MLPQKKKKKKNYSHSYLLMLRVCAIHEKHEANTPADHPLTSIIEHCP